MAYSEDAWRSYVEVYDIEVDQASIDYELEYIENDLRHRMRYDQMSGGGWHPFVNQELEEQKDEMYAAALFEAKESKVLKDIIARQGFTVTPEELQAEAEALAEHDGSTLEMVKRFFGEDFSGLERDVLEHKAREWACNQA